MTAGARREDRDRCLAVGMDSYLAKPVGKDALLAQVSKSIAEARESEAVRPSGADPAGEEPTLDMSVIDELRELGGADDTEFLAAFFDDFVADTETRLVELRHAAEADSTTTMTGIAHSIKGSSGQLGGRRLSVACARLEGVAKADGASVTLGDLRDVEAAYADLRTAMQSLVAPAVG